jgi:hypothetical protein
VAVYGEWDALKRRQTECGGNLGADNGSSGEFIPRGWALLSRFDYRSEGIGEYLQTVGPYFGSTEPRCYRSADGCNEVKERKVLDKCNVADVWVQYAFWEGMGRWRKHPS